MIEIILMSNFLFLNMIRVFLADEQPTILAGIRAFLVGTEFKIVGESSDRNQLQNGLEHSFPHLILVDREQASFHDFCAGHSIIKVGRQECEIVDFSQDRKRYSAENLLVFLRKIVPHQPQNFKLKPFTPREIDVIRFLAQGFDNKTIGNQLGISLQTVKEHVQSILRKTSMKRRTQVALWAVREKIVS
ncbi:MAG: response regulator transcription factor [Thermoguttaceae bacterium]